MRRIPARAGVGMAMAPLVLAVAAWAWADSVPLHTVPKPVLDAVRSRFTEARIAGADRDRGGRGFIYEVAIKHQGKNIDVTVTPEGAIVLIKREIAPGDLPTPAARALAKAYPGVTYRSVEAVSTVQGQQETLAYYEMDLVTAQRRLIEARVSADGTILKGQP